MTLMCGLTVPAWAQSAWTPTLTPGDRQIVVSWTAAPVSSGLSFSYALQWRTGPAAGWESIYPIASNIFSRTITGLTNGQSYQVQVAAVVGFGADPRNVVSLTVSATPAAKPSTPSAPSLTPGNAQLTVSWTAPSDNGAAISDYDVQYKLSSVTGWTDANYDGAGTSTTLSSLANGQRYDVQVRATNSVGSSDWSTSTTDTPTDVAPGKPAAPTVTVLGATALRVNWATPTNTGSVITGYTLQQSTDGGTNWSTVSGVSGTGTSHDVTGLTPGSAYVFRVLATNAAGAGAWSDASSPATPAAAPAAPAIPNLAPGDGQLTVSWSTPAANGAAISDYDVQYKLGSVTGWTDANYDGTGTSTTLSSLTNGQPYDVQVRAKNSVGWGGWSPSASATPATTATVPAAPAPPTLAPGNGRIVVSWAVPTSNGGAAISDYDVQYKLGSVTGWTDAHYNGTGTSTTLSSLTNGQRYDVQVRATNSVDSSDWSTAAAATPDAVPGKPAAPTVTVQSATSLQVRWTAPANPGTVITGYTLRRSADNGLIWMALPDAAGTGKSRTVTSLTPGTSYVFRVRATNGAGAGDWSDASSPATPAAAPAAPAIPNLAPGDGQLTVSWSTPAANGAAISDYDVQYKLGSVTGWTDANYDGTGTSTTLSSLTNGQPYDVQVRAKNSVGWGGWSPSASATPATTATVPAAPAPPTLAPGNGRIVVSWAVPTSNGGAAISDYDVQYKLGSVTGWTDAHYNGTGTSTTLSSLTNGQRYDVQVRAKNAVGWSDWSTAAAATPDAKPGKPAAPTVTVLGATSLRVNWTAPANTGSALTGYTLQQRANNGTDWSPVSGVSGTSHDVTGLTPGTAHVFRVLATNAAGDGAWSDSSSPVTPSAAPAAPAAPAIPTLRPGDRQLEVSWHAPGSDGGSTITGYNIQYRAGASGAWTRHGATDAGSTTTTISGLTNGQDYQVQVRAVNAQGAGPWVASATATPASATTPPEPVTPLGPGTSTSTPEITRFEATPLRDGKSTLSWAVSANTDVLSC